jgi:hypothetical protein
VRLAGALTALGLAACSVIREMIVLPPPDEGARREEVRLGTESCLLSRCRQDVRVGEEHLRVESRARRLSASELPGTDRGSLVERAAWATTMWMVRQFGGSTAENLVYAATRTVTGTAGSQWRATCDFAWVDEQTTGRDESSTSVVRMAEAQECRVMATTDTTVVRWRFRRGISPTPESIARALDTLQMSNGQQVRLVLPMSLERFDVEAREAGGYAMAEDTTRSGWTRRPALWHVAHADGVRIASLYVRGASSALARALDLSPAASAEEAAVLRLIAAAVMTPTEYP